MVRFNILGRVTSSWTYGSNSWKWVGKMDHYFLDTQYLKIYNFFISPHWDRLCLRQVGNKTRYSALRTAMLRRKKAKVKEFDPFSPTYQVSKKQWPMLYNILPFKMRTTSWTYSMIRIVNIWILSKEISYNMNWVLLQT